MCAHIQPYPLSEAGLKVTSALRALTSDTDTDPPSFMGRGKDLKLRESQGESVLEEGTWELGLDV